MTKVLEQTVNTSYFFSEFSRLFLPYKRDMIEFQQLKIYVEIKTSFSWRIEFQGKLKEVNGLNANR